MAPKRSLKAKPSKARQSPALAMMLESSPDRPRSSAVSSSKSVSFASGTGQNGKDSRLALQDTSGADPNGKAREQATTSADQLWCDWHAPALKSDLAIHKKKVEQVEGWLRDALDGSHVVKKYRRILALSGPAGSGKSSLVKILSERDNIDFELVDWKSEEAQSGQESDYYWDGGRFSDGEANAEGGDSSVVNQFGLFLSSASRYSTLAIGTDDGNDSPTPAIPVINSPSPSKLSRKVILLEDLPNVNHASTRSYFNSALNAFLQQSGDHNTPLIVVVSENIPRLDDWVVEGSGNTYRDRSDAIMNIRNLIPSSIRGHPGFTHIQFNPIAPTILTKALKRVIEVARPTSLNTIPAPTSASAKDLMEAIVDSSNGDVRSAINTLQVICLKGDALIQQDRGTKRKSDGKTIKKKAKKMSRKAIAAISGRESSLVLFHTLGKVLYNKRVGDPHEDEDPDSDEEGKEEEEEEEEEENVKGKHELEQRETVLLPDHMQSLARRKSKVDVEMLWRTMPVDSGTLLAFLQQNYPPFCSDIEQCAAFSNNISLSESLKPAHEEWSHTPLTDYYNFLISVHGSLLSLPSPMPRNQIRKMKGTLLFKKMKELREKTETLMDFQALLKEDMKEQSEEFVVMTFSEASTTSLVCEILPMISKIHPSAIPISIREMVEMQWKTGINEEPDFSEEELEAMTHQDISSLSERGILHSSRNATIRSSIQMVAHPLLDGTTREDEEEEEEIQEDDD